MQDGKRERQDCDYPRLFGDHTLCSLYPALLGKIKMNCVYGFRIRKAFESEENWYKINRYGAKTLMCWSVVIMGVGIACLFIDPPSVLTVAKLGFMSLLVPIVQTLYYARRL